VLRAGFIRGKQRFFCKVCNYHFTLHKGRDNEKSVKRKNRSTTIIDIAKAMGIAVSTVSRALKDHPDISPQTKKAVREIAAMLNYQPNTLAQGLSKRETRIIGVIIPDIETYFFSSILTGIQRVAANAGYKVMISQSNESHEAEVAHTHAFMTNWVDGLLICHSKETKTFEHIKMYVNRGIPIVHFDRVCEDMETSKVLLDDTHGSFEVTEHLIEQGCSRIALIGGPEHLLVAKKRMDGYLQALEKHNIAYDPSLVCPTDLSIEAMLAAVDELLERDKSVDALFCISDIGAIRILVHLKQKGIKVPGQLCLAGFGNEPMGEIIEPTLTTFNLQTFKIGETAAKLFLDQVIEGEHYNVKTELVKGSLIIRKSTCRKN
jgi:LacI family transcriptional regulator